MGRRRVEGEPSYCTSVTALSFLNNRSVITHSWHSLLTVNVSFVAHLTRCHPRQMTKKAPTEEVALRLSKRVSECNILLKGVEEDSA